MKKTTAIIALLAGVGIASAAHADESYGEAGCGLGTLIVGSGGSQILAGTTNGTAANQMFGITFGTSNCTPNAKRVGEYRVKGFVEANQVALADDIARGSGETIAALSGILGCSNPEAVSTSLQANFRSIYPNANVQPAEVSRSVIDTLKADPSAGCSQLI